jgi:hypothetical protein
LPLPKAQAADDIAALLLALQGDMKASLALSRVALQVLAASSPETQRLIDGALEDEIKDAPRVSCGAQSVLEDLRARIAAASEEGRLAQALERALRSAASRL